jgi:membrane fusion protein (multidrug efflux system)
LVIVLTVLAGIALAGWWWFSQGKANTPPAQRTAVDAATPVVVAETQAATDNVRMDMVGSGIAAASVTLYPAVAEEVERVLFTAGQQVKKDQLLIQLEDRDEELAVKLAKARVEGTQQLLKRYQRAQGSGAVAANALDEAEVAHRQAEIELEIAQEQLRQRSIRAPFAGVVGIAQVDPGERVGPDTALTTLDNRTSLSVAFQVPEPFLARLEQDQKLNLTNVAFPDRQFQGKITHIDSRIDPQTRTVTVRANVPNKEDLLRPGMSFRIRLALPGEPVIRVPELAVQWAREGAHVWIVREGQSIRVPVQVVRRVEGAVLAKGNMQAGEAVVVEGVQRLRPGRQVRVIQSEAAPALPTVPVARTNGMERS